MDKNKIIEILKNINNMIPEENNEHTLKQFQKQLFLVDLAINQIKSRCKQKKYSEHENETLNMVCASLVNLWINTSFAAHEFNGAFKANGYYIKKNSKAQIAYAKKLFDQWRSCAANLLIDDGFAFFTQKELVKT